MGTAGKCSKDAWTAWEPWVFVVRPDLQVGCRALLGVLSMWWRGMVAWVQGSTLASLRDGVRSGPWLTGGFPSKQPSSLVGQKRRKRARSGSLIEMLAQSVRPSLSL